MFSSVGLGLTLLPTLRTSYMACRGSGVRVSLAPLTSHSSSHSDECVLQVCFRIECVSLMRRRHTISGGLHDLPPSAGASRFVLTLVGLVSANRSAWKRVKPRLWIPEPQISRFPSD